MSETPGPNPEQMIPMDQLVNVDARERAHRPNGAIMSNHERDLIESHQEQISEGLGGFDTAQEKQEADARAEAKAAEQDALNERRTTAMQKLNDAVKTGTVTEFSAGGDYVKATGLSHEDVQALGFNGFGELKSAALAYGAEQEAADAQALAKAAKELEKTERREAAKEHADTWRAEVDAMQGKLLPEAPAEELSFAEKLRRGGELGVKREQELATKAREKAEAEARATADEKWLERASTYEVVTDAAGEARQAELADLLRRHDRAVLEAQADAEPDALSEAPQMDIVELMRQARANVLESEAAEAELDAEESDTHLDIELPDVETDPGDPDSVRITEKGLKNRLTALFIRAQNALKSSIREGGELNAPVSKYRKAAVGAVGVAAIVLATKFGYELATDNGNMPTPATGPEGVDTGTLQDRINEATEQAQDLANQGGPESTADSTRELAAGSNPWNESVSYAQELGYDLSSNDPSDVQAIDAIKDRVVAMNNITDANSLPVGYELRMPNPAEIEEIMKQYKK